MIRKKRMNSSYPSILSQAKQLLRPLPLLLSLSSFYALQNSLYTQYEEQIVIDSGGGHFWNGYICKGSNLQLWLVTIKCIDFTFSDKTHFFHTIKQILRIEDRGEGEGGGRGGGIEPKGIHPDKTKVMDLSGTEFILPDPDLSLTHCKF